MTTSGGQPGFVGLARTTRQVLGLPEFLPARRVDVARHCCWLLGGGWDAACADDRLVEFVVGIVEAVDEFVALAESGEGRVDDIEGRAEAEAASWLVDYLADGGGAPDRELLGTLMEPAGAEPDVSIDTMLFMLARRIARTLAGALATRLSSAR